MTRLSAVSTPCAPWTGRVRPSDGYGTLGSRLAHRVVWERANGRIPAGMELDHLCERRDCVALDHLELVTPEENKRRSRMHVWRTEITHCPAGHAYDEANTGRSGNRRWCRRCKRAQTAASRKRRALGL